MLRARAVVSLAVGTALSAALVAAATPALAGGKPSSGGTTTSAVTVTIATPASGSSVSAPVTVTGSAKSKNTVSQVMVSVDGGPATLASGTTSWSVSLSPTSGSHVISAVATDSKGGTGSTSVTVSVTTTSGNGGSTGGTNTNTLTNPANGDPLLPVGRGKQAAWGTVDVVLGYDVYAGVRLAYFRDSSSGASSYVTLPVDTGSGWSNADYVMTSASDLWVESGDGPVYVRHYHFSGSPLPNTASLASSQTFGNSDTRHGNIASLASGALVVVWHQQGSSGPQGQYVGYRSPSGSWQTIGPLTFMPTASSTQVVAQNPADGSVWVFSDADTYGAIGAIHLTESASGLSVDWTNSDFINTNTNGDNGPDPEYPDLALAPDASTGTLALAYQSAHRVMFNSSTTGSYVAIDRITTTGGMSFTTLPVYVERTSSLGLVVTAGQTWLAYRPIDQTTLTYTDLYADCYCNGSWQPSTDLGTFNSTSDRVGYGASRPVFTAHLSDGGLHLFALS